MGDPGLVHVQPEFQTAFRYVSAFFSEGFRLRFGDFDDKHEVIGIPTVRHNGFPLPVFSDRSTSAPPDTVIPVPEILTGLSAQVTFMQIMTNPFRMMFDSKGGITRRVVHLHWPPGRDRHQHARP